MTDLSRDRSTDHKQDEWLALLVARAVRENQPQITYTEQRAIDTRGWIIGTAIALTSAGIIGGVAMYGKLASLEQKLNDVLSRMDKVESHVYRGYEEPPS